MVFETIAESPTALTFIFSIILIFVYGIVRLLLDATANSSNAKFNSIPERALEWSKEVVTDALSEFAFLVEQTGIGGGVLEHVQDIYAEFLMWDREDILLALTGLVQNIVELTPY